MTLLTLNRAPASRDRHLTADWVELLALRSPDREYSRHDLITELQLLNDIDAGAGSSDQRGQSYEALADDTYAHLRYRSDVFGTMYPFSLTADGELLKRLRTSAARRIYVALLLASSGRWLGATEEKAVRNNFEVLTKAAVQVWLSDTFRVQLFGTTARGSRYSGNFRTKVTALAEDLGMKPHLTFDVPDNDTGDGGLDVVAWPKATEDSGPDNLRVFVQAATGLNFLHKQTDMRHERWTRWVPLLGKATEVLAVPYCYRSVQGGWYKARDLTTILLDRVRIAHLLVGSPHPAILDNLVDKVLAVGPPGQRT